MYLQLKLLGVDKRLDGGDVVIIISSSSGSRH